MTGKRRGAKTCSARCRMQAKRDRDNPPEGRWDRELRRRERISATLRLEPWERGRQSGQQLKPGLRRDKDGVVRDELGRKVASRPRWN
jgi:hypothetical protein